MVKVLEMAGRFVREETGSGFIALIGQTPELQGYATKKLYTAVKKNMIQDMLVQVSVWCVGEFGDLLYKDGVSSSSFFFFYARWSH